jgi:hypothetical protein
MYIQKLYRDSTIEDAIFKALSNNTSAQILTAEIQKSLFSQQEDVFVTLEVTNARKK